MQLEEGKADIEVTIDELVAMLPQYGRYKNTAADLQGRYVVVAANVTEAATDITLSGNNTVVCTSQKYNLTFLDITPSSFKPGFSLSAFVRICPPQIINIDILPPRVWYGQPPEMVLFCFTGLY